MKVLKRIIGAVVLLLTLAAVAGLSAYFEWMAPTVPGTIVEKQQRIIGGRHAAPGRYLSTSFTLQNETEQDRYLYGSPLVTDIRVDEQTYSAAVAGASVDVKYLPINPRMARLADQPLVPPAFWMFGAAAALGLGALIPKRTRLAVALCCGLTAALFIATPGPPSARLALAASGVLVAVVAGAGILERGGARAVTCIWAVAMAAFAGWPLIEASKSPLRTASAEIREVRGFRTPTSSRSRYAMTTWQEFDRVHATFAPDGASAPVFLLDFIDRNSGGQLAEGATVTVEYRLGRPETARLVQGSRTHYWKNAAVPVGAVLAMAWWATRKGKSRARTRPKAQPA